MSCCCGCPDGCCPGVPIEDGTFSPTECGPGDLGCPDIPVLTGSPCLGGIDDIAPCPLPEELEDIVGGTACSAFCLNDQNITGSLGSYTFDVVLVCVGDGTSGRAFIRYTSSPAPPGLDLDTWIETSGGFDCPDCSGDNEGTFQTITMWYDVFVNCGICNATDIVYGPPDECVPDTLYSVRIYYSGGVVCPISPP